MGTGAAVQSDFATLVAISMGYCELWWAITFGDYTLKVLIAAFGCCFLWQQNVGKRGTSD
jgi:hypothetical protein